MSRTTPNLTSDLDEAMESHWRRSKFEAIAACTKDGRPTYEQLRMNGMLPR